jgi:hypothetical protein
VHGAVDDEALAVVRDEVVLRLTLLELSGHGRFQPDFGLTKQSVLNGCYQSGADTRLAESNGRFRLIAVSQVRSLRDCSSRDRSFNPR